MPDVYRAAAPINHVTRDDPPMLTEVTVLASKEREFRRF
jgi:hypothetical protein